MDGQNVLPGNRLPLFEGVRCQRTKQADCLKIDEAVATEPTERAGQ